MRRSPTASADQRSPFEAGVPASASAPNAHAALTRAARASSSSNSRSTRCAWWARVKLKGGRQHGLVQTKDGLVHRVLPGNHIGQSDGRITTVEEGKISLIEIVPDGMGGFIQSGPPRSP